MPRRARVRKDIDPTIQDTTDGAVTKIDDLVAKKEQEIMEV